MPTLKITDGTTTVDFGNVTTGNYWLYANGYQPKVNGLRTASLGGRGIYADVEESIQFWITDTTAAGCYTRLNTLTKLLLQAARFMRGEAVSPVKIQYSPDGASVSSSGSPLEALLMGATEDDSLGIELAPTFDEASYQYKLTDLSVSFRRGVWLQGSEAQGGTATSDDEILSLTFATNVDYMSPTDVALGAVINGQYLGTVPSWPLIVIVGSGSTSIQNINASNTTGAPSTGGWTYVNDAANLPRNNYVLRYTPAGTSQSVCLAYGTASLVEGRRYAVIGSVRNNSSTTSFAVAFGARYSTQYSGSSEITETRTIKPYTGAFAQPQYVTFGTFVASVTTTSYLNLLVTASAASGSIDFDRIVLVEVDNASIVQFQNKQKGASSSYIVEQLSIENRFLTALTMKVKGTTTVAPITEFVEARNGGDVLSMGTAIRCMNLGTVDGYWRQNIGVGWLGTWTLTRTRVHLSPE